MLNTVMRPCSCLLILLITLPVSASKSKDAAALYARAQSLSALDDAGPYHLTATVLTESGATVGTLKRDQLAKDVWRSHTEIENFTETVIKNGKRQWDKSSFRYAPFSVEQFWSAARPSFVFFLEKAFDLDIKNEQLTGQRCVIAMGLKTCFDQGTGLMSREEDSHGVRYFSRYISFQGKSVASKVEVNDRTGRHYLMTIDYKPAPDLDAGAFQPDADASMEEQLVCSVTTAPQIVNSPDPVYPPRKIGHQVLVIRVWLADTGSIEHLDFAQSPGDDFKAAAAIALAKWRFKPALCDGKPKRQMITIEMHFMPPFG